MTWILLMCALARATSAEQALAAARAAQSYDTAVQTVRLVLVGRNGQERSRELVISTRRDPDAVRTAARFTAPAEVAGTALVLVDHPGAADEALLYLPALRTVTQVGGKGRAGAFMGSDFSFEDLELLTGLGGGATLVSEDAATVVLDLKPAPPSSYGRLRCTFDKSTMAPRSVELFDAGGAAVKRLVVAKVATVGGRVIPVESEMKNLKNGTSTRLLVLDQRVNVPRAELPDAMFTRAGLEAHR